MPGAGRLVSVAPEGEGAATWPAYRRPMARIGGPVAEIVLGVGSSHTPQLSTSAAFWAQHAARDERNAALLGADGRYHDYAELLAGADPAIAAELDASVWEEKFSRAQRRITELGEALAAARPDVVVVVGDDQRELFGTDGIPAIGLFTGAEVWDLPPSEEYRARVPADVLAASWAAHAGEPDAYRVHTELSAHLAEHLTGVGFDLALLYAQPEGRGLGHAFTFVRRRLGLAPEVPIVPVLLNTYFPPNVPSPGRCYRLGGALGEAIASFEGGERVAIFASGGLSHFVVLEKLDRRVLDALARNDAEALSALPIDYLRSGTSEGLNWITAAGALQGLRFELVDYIPAYRSPAGTGVGMAFALWHPPTGGAPGAEPGTRQGATTP